MNPQSTLLSFTMALSLVLSAGQSLAENGYFGISILDSSQHDYLSENDLRSYSYDNLGSDKPFSGFGVAILDGSEHDYVIDRSIDYVREPHNAYSGQGAKEFGVAILDDSIHDYVRDDDVSVSTEGMTLASTAKDHGVVKERQ